ncbi:MAG: exodeoxyribonuclease VII large subunit [Tissierellaceae bacterium]|nr:exodeoxyribonuclease VII large subunit [Tissierellaceae bacterium]
MKPLKVSEVNNYIKRIFTGDIILSNIEIEGEISNFKRHYSGHLYFSLKDDRARIRCVMFRSDAETITLDLSEGQKVIAKGYVSIYEQGGDYQLYVRELKHKGIGDLYASFEELKKKLEKEGLFNQEFKKDIPTIPMKIGIVTSSTGAAIKDIISVIKRRFPPCELLIYPSLVQGPNAPKDIIRGLKNLDNREYVDLIITGRGGGSIEELSAFNDEQLARTIFSMNKPVISAVGHETDFTIADFVADLRAPTPSAAAELAVPNIESLNQLLDSKFNQLLFYYENKLDIESRNLNLIKKGLKYNNPVFKLKNNQQQLNLLYKELVLKIESKINYYKENTKNMENCLKLLNPTLSLDRGNGILLDKDGMLIKSIDEVSINDVISILMRDGTITTLVKDVSKGEEYDGCK